MRPLQADVLPGFKTPLWGYNGQVPGPTIHVQQGRQTIMRHINTWETFPRERPGGIASGLAA